MKKLWFVNKTYGWGWRPATWEGWTVIAVWLVVYLGGLWWFTRGVPQHTLPTAALVFALVLVAALIAVCWVKGEKPRWRWGKDT